MRLLKQKDKNLISDMYKVKGNNLIVLYNEI